MCIRDRYLTFEERNSVKPPDTSIKRVGVIHTHWREGGNESFSVPNDFYAGVNGYEHLYLINQYGDVIWARPQATSLTRYYVDPDPIFNIYE